MSAASDASLGEPNAAAAASVSPEREAVASSSSSQGTIDELLGCGTFDSNPAGKIGKSVSKEIAELNLFHLERVAVEIFKKNSMTFLSVLYASVTSSRLGLEPVALGSQSTAISPQKSMNVSRVKSPGRWLVWPPPKSTGKTCSTMSWMLGGALVSFAHVLAISLTLQEVVPPVLG